MENFGKDTKGAGEGYIIPSRNYKPEHAKTLGNPDKGYQTGSLDDRLSGTDYSIGELAQLAGEGNYLGVFAMLGEMGKNTNDVERQRELALLYGLAAFGLYVQARNLGLDEDHPLYQQLVQPTIDYAMKRVSGYSPKGESANYAQKGYSPKRDDAVGYAGLPRQKYLD